MNYPPENDYVTEEHGALVLQIPREQYDQQSFANSRIIIPERNIEYEISPEAWTVLSASLPRTKQSSHLCFEVGLIISHRIKNKRRRILDGYSPNYWFDIAKAGMHEHRACRKILHAEKLSRFDLNFTNGNGKTSAHVRCKTKEYENETYEDAFVSVSGHLFQISKEAIHSYISEYGFTQTKLLFDITSLTEIVRELSAITLPEPLPRHFSAVGEDLVFNLWDENDYLFVKGMNINIRNNPVLHKTGNGKSKWS